MAHNYRIFVCRERTTGLAIIFTAYPAAKINGRHMAAANDLGYINVDFVQLQ